MIRDGYSEELDQLRDIVSGGKGTLARIEAEEREKTEVFALAERMGGDLEGAIRRMASERGTETPEVTIRTIIDNA